MSWDRRETSILVCYSSKRLLRWQDLSAHVRGKVSGGCQAKPNATSYANSLSFSHFGSYALLGLVAEQKLRSSSYRGREVTITNTTWSRSERFFSSFVCKQQLQPGGTLGFVKSEGRKGEGGGGSTITKTALHILWAAPFIRHHIELRISYGLFGWASFHIPTLPRCYLNNIPAATRRD